VACSRQVGAPPGATIVLASAIRSRRRPGSGLGASGLPSRRRSSAPATSPSQAAARRSRFIRAVSDSAASPATPAQAAADRSDSRPGP
jgi:hypothetical protein